MFLGKNCTKEINAPAGQTKQQQSLCLCGGLGGGEGEGERKGNREEERELLSIYLCVLSLLPHPHPPNRAKNNESKVFTSFCLSCRHGHQADAKTLWLIENKDGLTVMRLAADLALPSVFKMVLLELGGVYSHLNRRDGLFNFFLFDVVEIDRVAREEWKLRNTTVSNKPGRLDHRRDRSVLETICETKKVEKACGMLDTSVIRAIIKSKWGYYKRLLAVMIFFHFSFMVALTAYAIVKSEVIRAAEAGQPSSSTEKAFVSGMAVIVFIVALVLVVMEIIRWVNGQPWSITIHHHNGRHRLELCLIALCLIADSVWYVVNVSNSFSLPFI